MQRILVIGGIVAAAILLILANAVYVVPVDQQAIVIRFGQAQYTVNAIQPGNTEGGPMQNLGPGLHLKAPLIDDVRYYELLRALRSHGLAREMKNPQYKQAAADACPDLDPEFIFMHPAYNVRPTELNAVLGRAQLPRLDYQNAKRTQNLVQFLSGLDPDKYRTRYALEGSSNYAMPHHPSQ